MDECAQMSCAADMIGKSSTCNNGGGYFGPCPELLSLLDAMVMKRTTECESVRSNICETCPESLNAYYWCDHRFQEDMLGMYGKWSYKYYFDAFNCKTTTKILIRYNGDTTKVQDLFGWLLYWEKSAEEEPGSVAPCWVTGCELTDDCSRCFSEPNNVTCGKLFKTCATVKHDLNRCMDQRNTDVMDTDCTELYGFCLYDYSGNCRS